jgi:hypothetical protein
LAVIFELSQKQLNDDHFALPYYNSAMSLWEPISLNELQKEIEASVTQLDGSALGLWNLVKLLTPVKWKQEPYGNKGSGFWVVATYSNNCIYFNDIEDGFNMSPFSTWGHIDQYSCNQDKLEHVMSRLADDLGKRPR